MDIEWSKLNTNKTVFFNEFREISFIIQRI